MKPQESSAEAAPRSNHLFAYSVEEYDAGDGRKARAWTRIGAAFPHKEGPGFNIELKSIPLDGRIVLLPPDDNGGEEPADDARRDERGRGGNGNPRRR